MSASLYETDFYAWTQEQSDKLRRMFADRSNTDLDLENLAEEVESMGGSQRSEVENRLAIILEHLLKLAFASYPDSRNLWTNSVEIQRLDLEDLLVKNPSLRRLLPELAVSAYKRALRRTGMSRISLGMDHLPKSSPFDLREHVLSEWIPAGPIP